MKSPRAQSRPERGDLTREGTVRRTVVASLLAIGMAAWGVSDGAIVELGRKGQTASSSATTFRILLLSGNNFEDTTHLAGDTSQVILGRLRDSITAHPSFGATTFNDPLDLNRNAIDVQRVGLIGAGEIEEPYRVEVFEDDPNIHGAGIEYPAEAARDRVFYTAPSAVSGNGNVRLDLTLVNAGLRSFVISTVGKTAAQVSAELVTATSSDGFASADFGGGRFAVTRPNDQFVKVLWSHTDTGVIVSGLAAEPYQPPPPPLNGGGGGGGEGGGGPSIPMLSGWGLAVLAVLFAGATWLLLRRRRAAGMR